MADINFMKPKAETIKENARPKPRIFAKFTKSIRGQGNKDGVKKRKITQEELNAVKTRIQERLAQTNRRKVIFRLALIFILLIPVYFIGQSFFKSVEEGKLLVEKQREKAYKKRQEYIIEGYRKLKMNDFHMARWYFINASEIDPEDYLLQLGLTRTYINLCKYYDVDCGKAARSLHTLKSEYGNQPGIQKVTEEFMQMHD